MKFLIAFTVLAISAVVVRCDAEMMKNDAENMKMLMKIVAECKDKSGASHDDIKTLMMGDNPETKEAKCMFSCIMETMGILKSGEIQEENAAAWMKTLGANDEQTLAIYNACSNIKDDDVCETAGKIGVCIKDEGSKHKVKIGF